MIKYNPLLKNDGQPNGALTQAPSDSIVFDLPGQCLWVKGVKLKGTDHTYTFSHDNYITLANTPGNPEDIQIGVNITTLKAAIDTTYNSGTLALLQTGTDTENRVWAAKVLADFVRGILPTTQNMKINNIDYALYTTANSLPSFFAPVSLGIAGQVLSCTSAGLTWTNQTVNTDYQVTQSATSSNADYRILFKHNADDVTQTATTYFASTLIYNPSSKELKVNSQKVIHTGNINSANATIGDTLTTIATLGGVEIKAKVDFSQYAQLSQWDIEADKASFELTQEWTDSGVGLSGLSPGPCLLYINYCGVHYTGIFAYSGTTINTDDEFPLHCSGYTQLDRGRIFAKIAAVQGATKLMLAAQKAETNIPLFTIKIKQIAIL